MLYFTHPTLFKNKTEAIALTTNYYNSHWRKEIQRALIKKKYFKTPHEGIVFIPNGEVSYFNEDGAVYAIRVGQTEYFWDFREELYYDLYNNIYNPNRDVLIGNRTPRYIKEAYKTLCKIKIKHPLATIDLGERFGRKEAFINVPVYIPETGINSYESSSEPVFGEDYFSTDVYPEVGTAESFAPVWG